MPNPIHADLDELIALAAYARGASIAARRHAPAAHAGGHVSRWRGRGVDFRESRVYQPGDDIRHMDWRVTARSGKPHTKLFEEEREQGLLLALDCNPTMHFGTRVRFKNVQAARAAALLAWMAAQHGDRVGAIGFGGGIEAETKPVGGRRGVLRSLRALRDWDRAAHSHRAPLSAALARMQRLLRPGMRLALLSDGLCFDAAALPAMSRIAARHEATVVLIRDALELAAPPPGRYALRTGEARRMIDFADRSVRETWETHFAAARELLREACARLGVRVIDVDAHADVRRALAPILARSRVVAAGAA
jgi:uncharacterized protein (DUF58 family)